MAESSKGEATDLLEQGREAFQLAVEAEDDNRKCAKEDIRFARLGEQWDEKIKKDRETAGRPVLTVNMMNGFIRQVVNDARQNKPSIKVHPADDHADVETADIMNGLIRNIEYTSDAEVAYDTATEAAVAGGWGYFKIDYDYAHDDSTDLDIMIKRVANPFSIYGDPTSMAADSSDWNTAFEAEWMPCKAFEAQFPNADKVDWDFDFEFQGADHWRKGNEILLAKWWQREEVERPLYVLSSGQLVDRELFEAQSLLFEVQGLFVVREHVGKSWRVKRHLMTGAEILKTEDWLGKYIPIIPVYGDEVVDEEGKRHWRSLIRDGKDPQRRYNFQTTTSTELTALQPRVPWVGKKGAFKSDARRWASANVENHPYLEFDGEVPPQRMPLDMGPAAGAMQEAAKALDDMRATIGLYSSSLGEPSNERSGRAILARQREGDVSTFHFQDNMARAIRHAGRILIDLIPKVYNEERVIRVMGEDGSPKNVPLKRPVPRMDENGRPMMEPATNEMGLPLVGPDGQQQMKPVTRIYDLSLGKYDLTVTTGPSFTTKREEAAVQMTEFLRSWPQAAPIIGDLVAKNLDWPGADEIAKRLKKMLPPQLQEGGLPPEVQQMIEQGKQTISAQQQMIQQMQDYIRKLEGDRSIDEQKVGIDRYKAQTDRMETLADMQQAEFNPINVPDAGVGQYADFEGIRQEAEASLAQSRAAKGWADADAARVRALRESVSPMTMQPRVPG